jgi:hypothetical protein
MERDMPNPVTFKYTRNRETRGPLNLQRSYNFVEKKPIIDELRGLIDQEPSAYKKIHEESGVSVSTLRNWFSGKTISPRTMTVNAVLYRLGKRLGVVDL